MTKKKLTRFNSASKRNLFVAIVAAIAIGIVGYMLTSTRAAQVALGAEAEQNISGNAKRVADAAASGGNYLQFGSAAVQPPSTGGSPSGVPLPQGDLPGWKQIFYDDFTKDAPVGSWGSECDSQRVAYTGAQGQKWRSYPKCFKDTYQKRPYRADQVLSVKNGMLNFYLRPVDGQPAGANPSPLIDGTQQYQTYGRYTTRFRTDTANLNEYYVAWLLWPQSEKWPDDGEEDFPEGRLSGNVGGFHHYVSPGACVGCQDQARDVGAKFNQWHTYTIEWTPGRVKYILDGTVVLDSTKYVPTKPMRWQLQTETNGNGSSQGNLMVDWVAVYKYQP